MFKRRVKRTLLQKARELVWPQSGYSRAMLYLWRRLTRLQATPHAVALGFAIGVYMSFSPFLGFHLALSGMVAWMLGANVVASLMGNFLGNPVTYPFMWAVIYQAGDFMLGSSSGGVAHSPVGLSFDLTGAWDLFMPMLIGSVPIGIIAALAFYFPVRTGVGRFQAARRARFVQTHPTLAAGDLPSNTGRASG